MNVFTVILTFTFLCSFASEAAEQGSVSARFVLNQDFPPPPRLVVDKTIEVCGTNLFDPVLFGTDRAIQGIVLWIANAEAPATPPESNPGIFVQGHHCLFEPRIQAVQTGTTLTVKSADPTAHNPHGWLDDLTVFNITVLDPNFAFRRKLKVPGLYRIDCDTHRWMRAYIHVFDHPYFAVSDSHGAAVIPNIPAGKRQLKVWHEILGEKTLEIDVASGAATPIEVPLSLKDCRKPELKPAMADVWPPAR